MRSRIGIALAAVASCAAVCAYAQGPTVSMVVTEEAHDGATNVPRLEPQDIQVTENRAQVPVTGLTPLNGAPAQILLLIDDSAWSSLGTQFGSIKSFINALPANAEIAVGYMRNGMTEFTQNFTSNHAAAANSVRLPAAGAGTDVSPYDSLSDAIKHWPQADANTRKIAILITSGIEGLGGGYAPENQYVNASIDNAERAGVLVFGIYNPSIGHQSHVLWATMYGQDLLSQLCDETGGEAYIQTMGAPAVDFSPFFRNILDILNRQYVLTFTSTEVKKAGLQPVRVRSKQSSVDVVAAHQVFVRP